MHKPFLHDWLSEATGIPQNEITRNRLEMYQLGLLRKQIAFAKANSPFYAGLYANYEPQTLQTLGDFALWPQTAPKDLKEHNEAFLCSSQSNVWRIITLQTSGTTGNPKRLFFSQNDLDATARYFHYSLKLLARDCRNLMVFMPGNVPGSVGDVLHKALEPLHINCHQYGIITDFDDALKAIKAHNVDFIIGIPSQMLNLCRYSMTRGGLAQIKGVLLGADYISPFCVQTIAQNWQCKVIKHYGSTESALGAAVNCDNLTGCHIREAELLFEVVDPATKQPLPDGEIGEIVISSLNYDCMPLLRYNTGDFGAISKTPCQCESVLKRIVKMRPRNTVLLYNGINLDINDLDGVVYSFKEIAYYEAEVLNGAFGRDVLQITVADKITQSLQNRLFTAVADINGLKQLLNEERLELQIKHNAGLKLSNPYVLKRKITDLRNLI